MKVYRTKFYLDSGQVIEVDLSKLNWDYSKSSGQISRVEWQCIEGRPLLAALQLSSIRAITYEFVEEDQ